MNGTTPPAARPRDLTEYRFRRIEPADAPRLAHAFTQLSPTSRYHRFLAPVQSLSEAQLRTFAEVDFVDHVAWVAEVTDRPERTLAGVGRWIRSTRDPACAEIALTVLDAYQGRGLGTALLGLLVGSARSRGIQWFEATVLGENLRMRALLSRCGATRVGFDLGAYTYRLAVPTAGRRLVRPAQERVTSEGRTHASA